MQRGRTRFVARKLASDVYRHPLITKGVFALLALLFVYVEWATVGVGILIAVMLHAIAAIAFPLSKQVRNHIADDLLLHGFGSREVRRARPKLVQAVLFCADLLACIFALYQIYLTFLSF